MEKNRMTIKPWLKRVMIGAFILLLGGAGIYWYFATEKFADTRKSRSAYEVDAMAMIAEFLQNDSLANSKYTDKIITVTGTVSEIEAADTTLNIKFIDSSSGSYAIFAFQDRSVREAKTVRPGDIVSIKGSCSGGIYSDILEATAITFKRSTLTRQ